VSGAPAYAVEVCDLVKAYGSRRAVDGLNLTVPRGAVLALPAADGHPADAADAVLGAGLTRMTDPLGADREAILSDGDAPVDGITDKGLDVHQVAPLDDDATVVVRAQDAPLRVAVDDAVHGTSRTATARPGEPARLALRAGGDYEVHIDGPSGRAYTAAVS